MRTVLVAAALAIGALGACVDDVVDPVTFCTADALFDADGESYVRDPQQGCRWVDDEGRPLTTYPDGSRICYRDEPTRSVDLPCE